MEKFGAFLFGWAQMSVYFPANIAALSVIFGQQFVVLFNLPATIRDFNWSTARHLFNGLKLYFYKIFDPECNQS